MRRWLVSACVLLMACEWTSKELVAPSDKVAVSNVDWPMYGGGPSGDRYSKLAQINQTNVGQLQVAWRYDTGPGGLQTSPLVVGGVLYATTPAQDVIALNATNGSLKWQSNLASTSRQPVRGLAYWTNGKQRRLFGGAGTDLYSLDADTGALISAFGEGGRVDLRKGLGGDEARHATFMTSPGVIYKNLIIVGFRTSESKPAAPGAIRAYDVLTGELRWIFQTIPRPGQFGYETWPENAWKTAGGANSWGGMVVDQSRGILFVPTGAAVDDFYGGDRKGDNLFANSLLALDASTGKRLWHFQAIHHDLWDWDFPSPPVLLTVRRDGQSIDAVAQASKQGFVYLFDRVSGESLFPIEERTFPRSEVPGEVTSPTQPVPMKPAPFARQRLTEQMLTRRTPEANAWAIEQFKAFRSEGIFTPLATDRRTVVFPGTDGGAEWGGQAVDPRTGVFYVNSNDLAWILALAPLERRTERKAETGESTYSTQCAACHGLDRAGSPPQFPSLVGLHTRLTDDQIAAVLSTGRGRMPAFPALTGPPLEALIRYLRSDPAPSLDKQEVQSTRTAIDAEPAYGMTGFKKFLDPQGYPAVAPPWGTLSAIDLNTGDYLWQIPLGEYPELAAHGLRNTGTENYGGPIVTESGLVFIGATIYDRKFRAFDSRTGRKVWEGDLPFAGNATPVTYMVDGRQYVVIACSGGRDRKGPTGSAYVAFALPR